MFWSNANDVLEAIDATESDRGNAIHYYVFLMLATYMGFFFNALDAIFSTSAPAEDGASSLAARLPFATLKPLFWVSVGIMSAMFGGFLSIGTHDRQVWFFDVSFSGVNELRAFVGGPLKAFGAQRAYGVDEGEYEECLTAAIVLFISISLIYMASMSFPFTVRDSVKSSSLTSVTFILSLIAFVCGLIGVCVLNSLDMAAPTIHQQGAPTSLDTTCGGKDFNMYLDVSSTCFVNNTWAGERFSLNMMQSEPNPAADLAGSRYYQITTFTALAILLTFGNFMGVAAGNGRAVKFGLVIAPFTLLTIGYAMNWQGASGGQSISDQACEDEDDGECQSFKAGFAFLWLQAFFVILSGGIVIGNSFFAEKVLNDSPAGFVFCGCGAPCCKGSGSAATTEEVEMTDVAAESESREGVTDDL
jgi:hypothetical protein